jgi:hypothetical protein
MPVLARRRNLRRCTFDQIEGRQHYADAAARTWFDAFIDQMVGVDFTQPLQREGGRAQ